MAALLYLIDTLLSLAQLAFLLRLLLQWARADFRNPLVQAIVQLTSPVLVPLRRVLPAVGRLDTASALIVVVLALLRVSMGTLLGGLGLPPVLLWAELAGLQLLRLVLWIYFFAIFLYAVLSLIAPGTYSPAQAVLTSMCEPVLRPLRRLIPPLANLDLSPLWAGILIQALLILLR
jgi:YggT family protein